MIGKSIDGANNGELVGPRKPNQGVESTYKIDPSKLDDESVLLKVSFGRQAHNDEIVRDAVGRVRDIVMTGELNGKNVIIHGPASIPVAVALAHELGHVTKSVRVFDPKLNASIVTVSHDPQVSLGTSFPLPRFPLPLLPTYYEGLKTYVIKVGGESNGVLMLNIGFGHPANNDQILIDAMAALKPIGDGGGIHGKLVVLNGPASLPVAAALGYKLAHVCKAVAVFDPKLNKAVVAISHGPDLSVGDLIPLDSNVRIQGPPDDPPTKATEPFAKDKTQLTPQRFLVPAGTIELVEGNWVIKNPQPFLHEARNIIAERGYPDTKDENLIIQVGLEARSPDSPPRYDKTCVLGNDLANLRNLKVEAFPLYEPRITIAVERIS